MAGRVQGNRFIFMTITTSVIIVHGDFMMTLPLLHVKDVANTLGISISSAYRLMQTVIPTVRFGRTVRVRSEDLEKFIQDCLQAGINNGSDVPGKGITWEVSHDAQ